MITRTSQPANGALLLSEMKEFASFPKATQRYIRRSLDVAYGRRDAIECWARDEGEAASIRARASANAGCDRSAISMASSSVRFRNSLVAEGTEAANDEASRTKQANALNDVENFISYSVMGVAGLPKRR